MSIMGTFGSFTMARLGIYAAQKGLTVTGNNISNINTIGYTRQALDQVSLHSGAMDRYRSKYDVNVGSGVLCTGVSQLRDPYLDIRYRTEMASVGMMDEKLSGLNDIARLLDEVARGDDENGVIEAQLSDLLKTLQNLSKNTNLPDFDTQVRESASALVTLFNSYAGQLEEVHQNTVEKLNQDVTTVNHLLNNIRDLSDSIFKSEIHGSSALELRDERNRLIDELSRYVKIDVKENLVDIGAGQKVNMLTIRLNGEDKSTLMETTVKGTFATQLSVSQDGSFSVSLSEMKHANGTTSGNPVDLGDTALYGALQATRELLTEAGEFATQDMVAKDPNALTKRGIPYYQKSLDLLARKLAETFNEANSGYQYNKSGNFVDKDGVEILVNDKPLSKDDVANFTPDQAKALLDNGVHLGGPLFSISNEGDVTDGITAANISIAHSWSTGDVRVVNSFSSPDTEDASNILHMVYLMSKPQDYDPKDLVGNAQGSKIVTGTFQEMLNNTAAVLGGDMRSTEIQLNNYYSSAIELDTGRDSVSGVDLNDEAANLMQYQKSYSAACRLMTTFDEALDKLINGTGVVGR